MALLTICAELLMMTFPVIVFAVTRVALLGRFLVILVSMTGLTLRLPVSTDQRKSCFVVIEPDLLPAFCNVTVITGFSEATFMPIILTMTGVTVCWCRPKSLAARMAVYALDF